ncbi:MAG: aminopeptidase P family protein [Lachnospiraceae bacterium]|nr:aminopeptidase P family protein [Lachnospiraceae bacterium]
MSSIKKRMELLRERMKAEQIDYYLIPTADYHNSEYVSDYFKVREFLSGFTGSNGSLVISQKEAGLWTDGRYFIQAEKELEGSGIILFRMLEEGVPTIQEYLEKQMREGQTLGFDGRVVNSAYGKKLEQALKTKNIKFCYKKDLADSLWMDRPAIPAHPVMILPENICGQSVKEKLAQVRETMEQENCQAHIVSKLDDLMWLFNIRGGDVECNPVALSYGFFTMTECYLFLQKEAVSEELRKYAEEYGITLMDYNEIENFLQEFPYMDYQSRNTGNEQKIHILFDDKNVNYSLYRILQEKAELVNKENPTEKLKAKKNPVELAQMQEIYLKDSAAVTKFIYWLKKNIGKMEITEYSAAMYLDNLRKEMEGFLDLSFPTISGYKENAAMMHYEATAKDHKELKPEGMLLVDSGGQYVGGTTDVTRTIVLGEISQEVKEHFTAVAVGMLNLSNAHFLYGCTGRNLDILAREPLWNKGIDYKCGTGHGIGYILNVHEGPQNIRWRYSEDAKEAVLEEGMILSDEPGVYIEGSHGIRTENVIVVRKGEKNGDGQFMHFDTLTYVPIDLDAIDTAYMQPKDIERLNVYHKAVYEKISPLLEEEEREWLAEVTRPVS